MDVLSHHGSAAGLQATFGLAQVYEPGGYYGFVKIAILALMFVLWGLVCQWVDRDTDVVKTKREQWNLIVLSGGIAGLAMWLVIPLAFGQGLVTYIMGLAFWLVLAGGASLAYVVHRNGRVVAKARVLTMEHFKRLTSGKGETKTRVDKGQRVRVATDNGETVKVPENGEDYDRYSATQDFLFDVLWRRGSDVEMVMGKDKVRLLYRIDGVAQEQPDRITLEEADRVLRFLKQVAGLNPEERRRPQTGRIRAALLSAPGDMPYLEVLTSGSTAGERLRLKIRGTASGMRLNQIGLSARQQELIKSIMQQPHGMLIVSGAKQSGVTTTQYAIMRDHDAFMNNLHAIEISPMLQLENITQHKFEGDQNDVGYARQLQSVLRREPDIVLVGESVDRETVQIAARAAAGERRIYLGMEAKDCFDALQKCRDMVREPQVVADSLRAVTNQRLIRVLCTSCRQAFKPDEGLLRKLNLPVGKIEHFYRPPTEAVLDKKGNEIICQACQGTGYVGRTAVFEIVVIDDAVRELIVQNAPIANIRDYCRRAKMHDLKRAGLQKVFEGVTSLDEILRALRFDSK